MKECGLVEGLGSIRTEAEPKKTIKAYKLMRLVDGKLYPLFIDSSVPTEIGVWYDADSPDLSSLKGKKAGCYYLMNNDNEVIRSQKGKPTKKEVLSVTEKGLRFMFIEATEKKQKRFGENRKYWNIGINGSGAVTTFSLRPGWHAGSLPTMRQIGKGKKKDIRDDSFVWTEIEISADIDYNPEAQRNPDKDIPDHIPTNGYYMKATNADKKKSQAELVGWYVAGAMKINRIIGDNEARNIIDKFNANHPNQEDVLYDYSRKGGKVFNAQTMRLEGIGYSMDLFSDLEDEGVEGLGRVNREEMKKTIVDFVTQNLFSWKKPWKPISNDSRFLKVRGKIVSGIVNAYSLKPYGRNAISLWAYTQEFNDIFKTNFAPIFVSYSMMLKMGWRLIDREYVIGDEGSIAACPIEEIFWVKIKDEDQIVRIKDFVKRKGYLPYGIIEGKDGDYLEQAYRRDKVVLAENIVGNPLKIERVKIEKAEMIDYVDSIINAYSPNVAPVFNDQSNQCYYSPKADEIHLVPAEGFGEINEYYSTRFHETVHSTLAKKRLDRSFGSKAWGDAGYAEEELVAEIGAYMLCAELGVNYYRKDKATPFKTKENSMAYLASWVKKAKELFNDDEEKAIVEAYKYAEKAVDYILKGVDFESMIPDSVKQLEDEEFSDLKIFENEDLKVVDVRADERIRIFFKNLPSEDMKQELLADKFKYSKVFKAWQIINNKEGKEKVDAFLKNHYAIKSDSDEIRKKKIAIKAKALRIRQMQMQSVGKINYIMY